MTHFAFILSQINKSNSHQYQKGSISKSYNEMSPEFPLRPKNIAESKKTKAEISKFFHYWINSFVSGVGSSSPVE